MAKQVDRQALATEYLQLLQSGVPAAEAFKRVYPNGIPTQVQQAAIDAKEKQKNALAGTGGTIAGLLALKYGSGLFDSSAAAATAAGATPAVAAIPAATGAAIPAAASAAASAAAAEGVGAVAAPEAAAGLGLPSASLSTAGPIAAALGATYLGGRAGLDMLKGKKPGLPGRVILGMATGGLSEVGNALFGQKSTRDRQADATKSILGISDDPTFQAYAKGMREQFSAAPPDPSKPFFGGKYENFDEYKNAGLNARDLSGVEGNLRLGADYAKLTQELKDAYTQSQIAKNNYRSSDGGVQFVDDAAAKADFANFISGLAKPQAVTRPTPATIPAVSDALAKKQLEQTGKFGNQLLQAINGTR